MTKPREPSRYALKRDRGQVPHQYSAHLRSWQRAIKANDPEAAREASEAHAKQWNVKKPKPRYDLDDLAA